MTNRNAVILSGAKRSRRIPRWKPKGIATGFLDFARNDMDVLRHLGIRHLLYSR